MNFWKELETFFKLHIVFDYMVRSDFENSNHTRKNASLKSTEW